MSEYTKIQEVKAATLILERSNGDVLLCERSTELSFFPGFFVFPGGKIDDHLPDDSSHPPAECRHGA